METLEIKKRKVIKQGDSHYFYIPKVYFNNGQLNTNEEYDIAVLIPKKQHRKFKEPVILT